MLSNKYNYRHGGCGTRLYSIYHKMKTRCYNPHYPESQYYGDRGIKVCDEWLGKNGFVRFREWATTHGYTDDLSIDRIDVNRGYSPDNCRWATAKEQCCNKRNNKVYEINGKSLCLKEWCDVYGAEYGCTQARLNRGWNIQDALSVPIGETPKSVTFKRLESHMNDMSWIKVRKNKYCVRAHENGKEVWLGTYDTAEQAISAKNHWITLKLNKGR